MRVMVSLLAVLAGSMMIFAQEDTKTKTLVLTHQGSRLRGPMSRAAPGAEPIATAQRQVEFVAAEFGGVGVVKGAPYSAEATTETTQTLADGNRIHRKSTATVYRDGQGRTRREQTLGAIGPWAAPPEEPIQTIFISDPVAGLHYVLDPDTRTARKMPLPPSRLRPAAAPNPAEQEVFEQLVLPAPPPGAGPVPGEVAIERRMITHAGAGQAKTEPLGTRVIEGVEAEGTRTVLTIPAGQIGNERPIEVVSERWYSPQLQILVLSKRNDPRFGETTYRLTNINRSEPLASLFQVPPDFTVKEGPPIIRRVRKADQTK